MRGTDRAQTAVERTLEMLRRQAGAWKIRCYLYASNQPGAGTPQ